MVHKIEDVIQHKTIIKWKFGTVEKIRGAMVLLMNSAFLKHLFILFISDEI